VAPGYAAAALRVLQEKKNLRILAPADDSRFAQFAGHVTNGRALCGIKGGILVQSTPRPANPGEFRGLESTTVATMRQPDEAEWEDMAFAWAAVQSVKSNAILLGHNGASVGIGAGQTSRVDAVILAARKAREAGHDLSGLVLASDAFFPFRDGVDAAAEAGVAAIVQPGGSKRDAEVVAAADEHGMAMVFTGRRTFRH
jgi:AICAR transformylase/IMP cyclohydrolase PurH